MSETGITVFCPKYAKEALLAQLLKHEPVRGLLFKSAFEAICDKIIADGFVFCKASDDATKARMLALEKNAFIAFKNGGAK